MVCVTVRSNGKMFYLNISASLLTCCVTNNVFDQDEYCLPCWVRQREGRTLKYWPYLMVSPKAPLRSIACLHKQRLLWHKGGFHSYKGSCTWAWHFFIFTLVDSLSRSVYDISPLAVCLYFFLLSFCDLSLLHVPPSFTFSFYLFLLSVLYPE